MAAGVTLTAVDHICNAVIMNLDTVESYSPSTLRTTTYIVCFMIVAAAILNLIVKMAQEHMNYPFIIFMMPDSLKIDTSLSIFGYMVFKMASAAISNVEVK